MICFFIASIYLSLDGLAADPFEGADPIWNLLHSPAVQKSLRINSSNQKKLRSLLDTYDIKFLPYRNQSLDKTRAEVEELWNDLLKDVRKSFSPTQWTSLTQLA